VVNAVADFSSIKFQPNRPLLREISAERLNSILEEIKRNKPKGERGITVRQDGTGTYIGLASSSVTPQRQPETQHPFEIVAKNKNETQCELFVRAGTINQLIATNSFDGPSLRNFSYAKNQIKYVVLTATGDGTKLVSCALSVEDAAPSAQTPLVFTLPSEVKILLGIVYNTSVHQIVYQNIVLIGKEALRTAKTSPAPGEVAFNVYYVWG
jgi:hypothetical protein